MRGPIAGSDPTGCPSTRAAGSRAPAAACTACRSTQRTGKVSGERLYGFMMIAFAVVTVAMAAAALVLFATRGLPPGTPPRP